MIRQTKKALIVSPYLDHLGGGERYMLSVARALQQSGYEIFFAWDNLPEIANLTEMLGIDLTNPKLDPHIKNLYFSRNPISMYLATRGYDVVVYLSDGSLPALGSRRNIVHLQVPFHDVGGRSFKNQFKKRLIDAVIVNSRFTKNIVDREYDIQSRVVYPPVSVVQSSLKKEKIILSVGRFEPSLNAKKQDILIRAFRQIYQDLPGWKLVLAGASSSSDWIAQLQKLAGDLPVEFAVNAKYDNLCQLYAKAPIYWHAAGFGLDEHKNPELVEHFGITTAEAIGYGCLPLVVPFGGQREIVTLPELQWQTVDELCRKTLSIIESGDGTELLAKLDIAKYNESGFNDSIRQITLI